MGNNNRRKHHKIDTFPPEFVKAVNRMIVKGHTYDDIAAFLADNGFDIHKSSVQRYGQSFLKNLDRLKVVKEQAKAIVEIRQDSPATEMGEAANMLAMNLIMEALMEANTNGAGLDKKLIEAMKALAKLESSSVAREKLKYEYNKGVEAAVTRLKDALKAELNANPELMEKLLAIVEHTKVQVST